MSDEPKTKPGVQNDYDRHLFGLTRAEADAIHERCDVTSLKDGPPELVRAMLKLEGFLAKTAAELVRP